MYNFVLKSGRGQQRCSIVYSVERSCMFEGAPPWIHDKHARRRAADVRWRRGRCAARNASAQGSNAICGVTSLYGAYSSPMQHDCLHSNRSMRLQQRREVLLKQVVCGLGAHGHWTGLRPRAKQRTRPPRLGRSSRELLWRSTVLGLESRDS